jgi:hypothetical protein
MDTHVAAAVGGGWRLRTMLRRPGKGRKRGGIDSHVLRPMITALAGAVPSLVVMRLKAAMSPGRRHGSVPFTPMPPSSDAATTRLTGGRPARTIAAMISRDICLARRHAMASAGASLDDYANRTLPQALGALEDYGRTLARNSTEMRDSFDRSSAREKALDQSKQVRTHAVTRTHTSAGR